MNSYCVNNFLFVCKSSTILTLAYIFILKDKILSINTLYINFISPEDSGKKIGLFRIICAIFGGLIVSYLLMTILGILIPTSLANKAIIPLLFYPFAWSCIALWISLSPSKLNASLRVILPTLIFSISIYIFYKY